MLVNPLLFPIIYIQGKWVRRKTPRLPDAGGANEGIACPDKNLNGSNLLKIIFIGESTISGIGAPSHEFALSGYTSRILANRSGHDVQWSAIGLSGASVRMMIEQLTPKLQGKTADLVILPIGVNDVTGLTGLKRWDRDVRCLIETVRSYLGDVKIVINGPPPLNCCPAFPKLLGNFLGKRSRILDAELAKIALTIDGVIHVPMIPELQKLHFCEDYFHPSVEGYAFWAEYLCDSISY